MHPKVIEAVTRDITRWMNIDELALMELKLEYGEKFLCDRYPGQMDVIEAMKHSEAFWTWWRELWAGRDRELMRKCDRKQYGFNYTFLLNGYIGETRMQDTRRIYHEDVWEFYQDFHYWRKVDLYPNNVLVNECLNKRKKEQQLNPISI